MNQIIWLTELHDTSVLQHETQRPANLLKHPCCFEAMCVSVILAIVKWYSWKAKVAAFSGKAAWQICLSGCLAEAPVCRAAIKHVPFSHYGSGVNDAELLTFLLTQLNLQGCYLRISVLYMEDVPYIGSNKANDFHKVEIDYTFNELQYTFMNQNMVWYEICFTATCG